MSTATEELLASGTDTLNALLRGELAAVGTYTQAIAMFDDPVVIGELQKIRDEHRHAEREIRDCVVQLHGVPAKASGLWGAFAAVAAPGTMAVGCAAVLAALLQGEEHEIAAYQDALTHDDVCPDCARLIGTDLLPAVRGHVVNLNRLLGGTC